MLSHRQNNLLVGDTPEYAASWDVYAYPVGAVIAANSSGSTITVDPGHSVVAGDKGLIFKADGSTIFTAAVDSVTATTIVFSPETVTVVKGELFVNVCADTGTAVANLDASRMKIWQEADPAQTPYANSKVTTGAAGNYDYYHKGSGAHWELIVDTLGVVRDVIAGFGGSQSVVNVADYGAAGDGVADDTAGIQAAIDAASSGGIVTLPQGDYLITAAIVVKDGVTLVGVGQDLQDTTGTRGSRIITATASINMIEMIGTTTVAAAQRERAGLRNLSLDGQTTAGVTGVKIFNARRIALADVFVDRCITGLLLGRDTSGDTSYQYNLTRVHISSGTDGIATTGTADAVFLNMTDCEIRSMTGDGMTGRFKGKVSGGFFGAIGGICFDLNQGENITFTGLLTENCVKDFHIHSSSQNVNLIGVSTANSSATYSRTISIHVESCDGGVILGNQVAASVNDNGSFVGIQFDAAADNMLCMANSSEGFTGSQVVFSVDSGANSIIHDNASWIQFSPWRFSLAGDQQVFNLERAGDTTSRMMIKNDGTIEWGSGSATRDTILSRTAADTLSITSARWVTGTVTALDDTGTPTVAAGNVFKTGGTTAITDFDDGVVGQTITILAEHAITITDGAPIVLNGSVNFVMASGDTLTLTMFNDQIWQEVSRTVNL